MDEPPQEPPEESLKYGGTATSPPADQANNQEGDDQKTQAEEEGKDQTDHGAARQTSQPEPVVSGQVDHQVSEQTEHREYNQVDPSSAEQTDDRAPSHAENVAEEQTHLQLPGATEEPSSVQTERRLSTQGKRRASEQAERRRSSQGRRASEQADRRLSTQFEKRSSKQMDRRLSGMTDRSATEESEDTPPRPDDRKASKQTDSGASDSQAEGKTDEDTEPRGSDLAEQGTSKQTDGSPARKTDEKVDHADHTTSVKSTQAHDQDTKVAEKEPVETEPDQAVDSHTTYEQDNYSAIKQAEGKERYLSFYGAVGQSESRGFPQLGDWKETEYRIEPCRFEDSQIDVIPKISGAIDTESETNVQSFYPVDTRFSSSFQGKDQALYQKLPSIPTKSHVTCQEKMQATEIRADNTPDGQEKTSQIHIQSYKKRLPPIVYEDPYQVSLRYMEKHHILQIFQITENLVYEKPEDPLNFMLCQVKEMMRKRDRI